MYIIYVININIHLYIYISTGNHRKIVKYATSKSNIFSRKVNKIRME